MRIRKETIIQFIKFGLVGVSNTLIALAVYYVILWFRSDWYLAGNVVGWVVSVANAFFWNERYVFTASRKNVLKKLAVLGKTYLSYGATFILSTVLLYVEVDVFHYSAVLCPVINLLVTIPLNFLLNKFWTFR